LRPEHLQHPNRTNRHRQRPLAVTLHHKHPPPGDILHHKRLPPAVILHLKHLPPEDILLRKPRQPAATLHRRLSHLARSSGWNSQQEGESFFIKSIILYNKHFIAEHKRFVDNYFLSVLSHTHDDELALYG
jgi:hypothetical protein